MVYRAVRSPAAFFEKIEWSIAVCFNCSSRSSTAPQNPLAGVMCRCSQANCQTISSRSWSRKALRGLPGNLALGLPQRDRQVIRGPWPALGVHRIVDP
jgi:hypothetical protein